MLDTYTVILIAIAAAFIAVLIAIVVFMGYLRKILSIASFMSPNATIFAIGSKYTEMENINRLLEMTSINEVLSDIKKEGYDIENLEKSDIEIEKVMIQQMKEVVAMMPEGVRQFAEVYMLKFDANIVKRILRAKFANMQKHRIYDMVYEGMTITKLIINHMVEATTMEDAISALDATPFKDVISVWGETNNLYDVDLALDKIVLEKLIEAKSTLDEDSREAIEKFVSILIDIHNIKAIVRAKSAGMGNVDKHLMEGGYELSDYRLRSMAEARNIDELMANLEGTSYSFLRELRDPFEIEISLDRFLLEKVNEIGLVYSISSGPLVMFLISKEYEARNLKAIIKGFIEGIPKDRIKDLLVGVAT